MSRNLSTETKPRDDLDVARDKIVMVRLTAEEHEAWQALADDDQRKLSDWIRIVVNTYAKTPKPKRGR